MRMPQTVIEFLKQNKDRTRKETIEDMMKTFNYKESTAELYYSHRNSETRRNVRKIVFSFLEENIAVLYDNENTKYADMLEINVATYANYKAQYKSEFEKQKIKSMSVPKKESETKYYKNRLRLKFEFDDSRLFG